MQIQKQLHILFGFLNQLFDNSHSRRQPLDGFLPNTIGVYSGKLSSGVAMHHSIHVEHGDNFEHKIVNDIVELGRRRGEQ